MILGHRLKHRRDTDKPTWRANELPPPWSFINIQSFSEFILGVGRSTLDLEIAGQNRDQKLGSLNSVKTLGFIPTDWYVGFLEVSDHTVVKGDL